ncbi:MAG: cytochrome family [Solirubrobacteraceae bacterium]|nr:cytochrome family [Solirubrobacteraceae bacterium]
MTALPPGSSAPPALQTLRWLVRPISFLEANRRAFGDAFSVMFLGFKSPMIMLSDPAAIRALYTERANGLPPGRTVTLRPIMGDRSVLLLEGADHLARRKVMLPPFHGDRMRAYEPIVRDAAEREIARWPAGEAFPVHPSMQTVTLEVILRAVFGVEDRGRRSELSRLLGGLLARTSSPALQFGILAARRFGFNGPLEKIERDNADLDALLLAEIKAHGEDGDDILSLLKAARFEDGEPMSDREIRDQLVTLLLAGHETTATALAWTFDLLLRHPAVLERLTAAVDAGEDAYVRATVSEALRLRPVVPLAGRRLTVPLETPDLSLPAGTDVTPAIWLTHTREDIYPEPYAFRPERFLDGGPPSYAWIPFGGGVRRCLGAAFAELEMRVVLTAVLRARVLRPASPSAERVARRNVTFSPAGGTRILAAAR